MRQIPLTSFVAVATFFTQPAIGQYATVVNVPPATISDDAIFDSNTQFNVYDGGVVGTNVTVGDYAEDNTEINIYSGLIGRGFEVISSGSFNSGVYGSRVNVFGGTLETLETWGSQVAISGGNVGPLKIRHTTIEIAGGTAGAIDAALNSTIVVSGGSVSSIGVWSRSTLDVEGGTVESIRMHSQNGLSISGGAIGDLYAYGTSESTTISGGQFRLNGVPIAGLESLGNVVLQEVSLDAVLSGLLADGTPFAFSDLDGDQFGGGAVQLKAAPVASGQPVEIQVPADDAPLGVRDGQTLTLTDGGLLPNHFNAGWGSTVNIAGGEVGRNFEASGAAVVISDGFVGPGFDAFSGSDVLISGGIVASGMEAFYGSEIHVSGGLLESGIDAFDGSRVSISGGSVGERMHAQSGSEVTLAGGVLGDQFMADTGSSLTVSGGEFRLDGALVPGLDVIGDSVELDLLDGQSLSGVSADGTPFAFSSQDADLFAPGTLTLQSVTLPATGPSLIVASTDALPSGIRESQTLLVDAGGVVDSRFSAGFGSTLILEEGGRIETDLETAGAEVFIYGGMVGPGFEAFHGSNVHVSGGLLESGFEAFYGSQVSISGGVIGEGTHVWEGSQMVLAGGIVGDQFSADAGSQLIVSGAEFRINGVLVEDLQSVGDHVSLDLPEHALLSGVLVDGTPFAFSGQDGDEIAVGVLMLEVASLPAVGPPLIIASTDGAPSGIRESQTLVVAAGGVVGNRFSAGFGSTLIVEEGGRVGADLEAVGAEVLISGGVVGSGMEAFHGSNVHVSGGLLEGGIEAFNGSQVLITGGSMTDVIAHDGSVVTISGGFGGRPTAFSGATINLIGSQFALDGIPIELQLGETALVTDRRGMYDYSLMFSGILADGTAFEYSMQTCAFFGCFGGYTLDATLTVTLVPEPSSCLSAFLGLFLAAAGLCRRLA
jgi:hypothetical protein